MEKASDNNNNNSKKLSNMLQKALTIGHGAAPFSPVRDYRHHRTVSTARRGYFFSSPMTPLLPTSARARRRTKSSGVVAEPTSPKVSCIGQIKLAKSKCPETNTRAPKNLQTASSSLVREEEGEGGWWKLKRLFSTRRNPSRKSSSTASAAVIEHPVVAVEAVTAPSLGKMKKFATSRESLGGFDWKVEMKRQDKESRPDHRRGYSSDDQEEVIPCSVSMPLSHQREGLSLCPRQKSEVNLWERRTVDRPKPLQVKPTY